MNPNKTKLSALKKQFNKSRRIRAAVAATKAKAALPKAEGKNYLYQHSNQ
jgi:hypothetical protein